MEKNKEFLISVTLTENINENEIVPYKNDSTKTIIVTDYKNKTKTRTDIIKCNGDLSNLRCDNRRIK